MTFDWALEKLRDGKKVYRKGNLIGWSKFVPWISYNKEYGNGKEIWENMFGDVKLSPAALEATDWEVHVPDKKCACSPQTTNEMCANCGGRKP